MTKFILFALYLAFGTFMLVAWPVMLFPTLSGKRKLLIITIAFLLIVPGGLALYMFLGVPPMAAL